MSNSGAELTVLELSDMSRCVSCRRLVTLRRLLSYGRCRCGARKVLDATFLDEDDLLEIEGEYGWNVKIKGAGRDNLAKGLLPRGDSPGSSEGNRTIEIDEARLHSREASRFYRERGKLHDHFGILRWWEGTGLGRKARNPAEWNNLIKSFRKPFYFFGKRDEG